MADVEPDYTDPLEAAVAAELIELRPDIREEGARAGAHVIVSGVDAAAGTMWPPRPLGYQRARSRLIESADRAVAVAVQTLRRKPTALRGKPTTVHPWRRNRPTAGLEKLDADDLAKRAAGAVRTVDPPPQVAAE
jgi:hypothetical protein